MSAKITAYRRELFLKFLSETGNQTISAERAKVSRSWVQLHRSQDTGFDADCVEAIAAARDRLGAAAAVQSAAACPHPARAERESPSPVNGRGDKRWRYHDGHELVVAGSNGRRAQVRRARAGQWTPRVERRFLDALAATCSVKAACAEAGMTAGSAYAHRQRWSAFANAWDAAIETGYARIEEALVYAGSNLFSDPRHSADGPIREMTAEQALQLLNMHKNQVRGIGARPGRQLGSDELMERVRARIEKKMRMLRMID